MPHGEVNRRTALVRLVSGAAFAVCLAISSPSLAADDADTAGERLFSQCKTCHEVGEGARHKIGPHLDGHYRTCGRFP